MDLVGSSAFTPCMIPGTSNLVSRLRHTLMLRLIDGLLDINFVTLPFTFIVRPLTQSSL